MKMFLAVIMAVMLIGGIGQVAEAVDFELNLGVKQVSVMEGPGQHFVMIGGTVSHSIDDLDVYAHVMGDFSNETVSKLEADGTHFEIGATHPLGESSSVRGWFSKSEPFTSVDTETISIMGSFKF